ncbi:MAG: N-acetyltransferase [Burkholderiaceae bacterium]|nr:N-acetyltransferase [Burkholderiaceae bacterium]
MAASVNVRAERPEDRAAVRAVNLSAFDTAAEANLVDALRDQVQPVISLVAEIDAQVIGHIMFSPVTMDGHADLRLMGLAPMAVSPEHQSTGIGSALVRAGLQRCSELGFGAVVVLGHPPYYPRVGFQPSVRFGITSEYDAPAEAFMVVELQPGYLRGATGTVRYHEAFKDV